MTLIVISAIAVMLALVLCGADPKEWAARKADEASQRKALLADIRGHGKSLKDHGKDLQEEVQGGKKCPKCGHPVG